MFMITILVAALVFVSFGLVITVPVALATPGEWEASRLKFNNLFQIWISLVLFIAGVDGILSSI